MRLAPPLLGASMVTPTALSATVALPWLSQVINPVPADVGVCARRRDGNAAAAVGDRDAGSRRQALRLRRLPACADDELAVGQRAHTAQEAAIVVLDGIGRTTRADA